MMNNSYDTTDYQDLIFRLRKRAEIRRQAATRKSVQEGKPDRISDLLEEAAYALEAILEGMVNQVTKSTERANAALDKAIGPDVPSRAKGWDEEWEQMPPVGKEII